MLPAPTVPGGVHPVSDGHEQRPFVAWFRHKQQISPSSNRHGKYFVQNAAAMVRSSGNRPQVLLVHPVLSPTKQPRLYPYPPLRVAPSVALLLW